MSKNSKLSRDIYTYVPRSKNTTMDRVGDDSRRQHFLRISCTVTTRISVERLFRCDLRTTGNGEFTITMVADIDGSTCLLK